MFLLNQSYLQPYAPTSAMGVSAPRIIELDLDKANILSKKMSRRRVSRRQAYAIALTKGINGEI